MNKNDLVEMMAQHCKSTKADATKWLNCLLKCVEDALKKGKKVRLVGFGTFSVHARAATEGRNPRTGKPIKIPASKQPKFRAGKGLKEAVNKGKK